MAKNNPTAINKEKFPRKAIPLREGKTDNETARNYADMLTSPEVAAYRVINGAEKKSGLGDQIDIPTLLGCLRESAAQVNRGNLVQAEAMLINQATALQSLFARLSERGMGCDGIQAFEVNMRMALRAQSQCRTTLETLAEIKNPRPVAFVKQANIANGPQQVNNQQANNTVAPDARPAREDENQQSKLLEADNGKWMDTGTAGTASGTDKAMATVGEIDGA